MLWGPGAFAQQIALPHPPAELRNVPSRAGWLVEHYWDLADMQTLTSEGKTLEQSFVNYLSVFPLAECDSLCNASVSALMKRADTSFTPLPEQLLSLAEKYLYTLDSPSANEEYFLFFVEAARACERISPEQRSSLDYWTSVVMNQRKGSFMHDFSFETPLGRQCRFSSIPGERLLLLFDVNCADCHELMRKMQESPREGVTVVAVAVGCTRKDFRRHASSLPRDWVTGWDYSGRLNGDIFAIRRLPDLYSTDASGRITAKHIVW